MLMLFAVVGSITWVASIVFGAMFAAEKKRSTAEGVLLGCLFGPLGLIVEALLPDRAEARRSHAARRRQFSEAIDDKEDDAVMGWLADDGLRGVRR